MPDYPTADQPEDVVLADLNGDGRLDIVTANFSGTVSVLLGDGAGGFLPKTDYAVGAGPVAVAVADLNNDGRLDIITANSVAGSLSVLRNMSGGLFASQGDMPTIGHPDDLAIGDIDKDGNLDIVSVSFDSPFVSGFWNLGGRSFGPAIDIVASPSNRAIALGDLDNDGDLDIALAGEFRTTAINGSLEYAVTLLHKVGTASGIGSSTFGAASYVLDFNASADIALADIHPNGMLDIVSVGEDLDRLDVRVHRGGIGPGYSTVTGQSGADIHDVAIAPDGRIAVAQGFRSSGDGTFEPGVQIFTVDPNGVPQAPRQFLTGGDPTDIAWGDVNGDGRPDLVVSHRGSDTVQVLLNDDAFHAPVLATGEFGAGAAGGGWTSDDLYPRRFGDVNGDGRADLVAFGEYGVTLALAQADGTFAPGTGEIRAFARDPNSGGFTDAHYYPRELADVNGDGRADIVAFGNDGVYVSLATADGHFDDPFHATNQFGAGAVPGGGWVDQDRYPRLLGDVNGDGRADIVGFGENGAYVALNTGDGHFAPWTFELPAFAHGTGGGWESNDRTPRLLADLNGDGRDDIIALGDYVYFSLAQADGGFSGYDTRYSSRFGANSGWTTDLIYPRFAEDMNGDGFADLVGFGEDGVYVSYGDGNGDFTAPALEAAIFAHAPNAGGLTDSNTYPRAIADVTGDGIMDLLGIGDAGVYLAEGALFF